LDSEGVGVSVKEHGDTKENKKFWEELIRISNLFEVNEPNLMEINLSELTVASFNSI
jgi:hypothetical protein